jgi:hypothetical protein
MPHIRFKHLNRLLKAKHSVVFNVNKQKVRTVSTVIYFFARHSYWTRASLLSRVRDHTQTHQIRQDTSGWVIGPSQKTLPDKTQHSQETDIDARDVIRTRNPRK